MNSKISKLEAIRQNGKTQVDEQRNRILDAAEQLFLQKGIEHTSMTEIAAQASITRMSLYRYFPDRDTIAFETAIRMFHRMHTANERSATAAMDGEGQPLEMLKQYAYGMMRNFAELRDVYRYFSMFDHLYRDHYPTQELANWYKQRLWELEMYGISMQQFLGTFPYPKQAIMLVNTINSFLQRMAARGDLMSNEQEVPLEEQLDLFEEMIQVYLEWLERADQARNS